MYKNVSKSSPFNLKMKSKKLKILPQLHENNVIVVLSKDLAFIIIIIYYISKYFQKKKTKSAKKKKPGFKKINLNNKNHTSLKKKKLK